MLLWKWKIRVVAILILVVLLAISIEDLDGRTAFQLRGFEGSYFNGEKCYITTYSSIDQEGIFYGQAVPGPSLESYDDGIYSFSSRNWYCPLGFDQVDHYKDPRPRLYLTIPIRWGERNYLLSKSRVEEEGPFDFFCDAIQRGEEPRERALGSYYLMYGHWNNDVFGQPRTAWGENICNT